MNDFKIEWDLAMTMLQIGPWSKLDAAAEAMDGAIENPREFTPAEDPPGPLTEENLKKMSKSQIIKAAIEADKNWRFEMDNVYATIRETLEEVAEAYRDELLSIPEQVGTILEDISVVKLMA